MSTPLHGPDHFATVADRAASALAVARMGAQSGADPSRWAACEAVMIALAHEGLTEGGGDNKAHFIATFREFAGRAGDWSDDDWGAWCAYGAFGAWGWGTHIVGRQLGVELDAVTRWSGSTARAWQRMSEDGHAVPVSDLRSGIYEPRVGDIWIRNNEPDEVRAGGRGSGGHTGLVAWYDEGTRTIWTIEGNTDADGEDADGGGWFAKSIHIDDPRLLGVGQLEVARR